ncbi:MAG: indolepyruvate oxidoreductase subunit beta [candidate division WOR-3 bacterium]|jgi:indolepyruvate ferredoxin oxidoreductase beta subunit
MPNKAPKSRNIIICGVGGQGIILASEVLCHTAFLEGLDVKKSEVHGMAQRGGSVITHVRFGKKVYSPLIEEGTSDYILAFEKLEALRYKHYLKKAGHIIVDNREIPPMSVLVGQAQYPEDIDRKLMKLGKIRFVDAAQIALELGNIRVVNIILLGVLSTYLDFTEKAWMKAISDKVKEKFVDLNIRAFNRGRELSC